MWEEKANAVACFPCKAGQHFVSQDCHFKLDYYWPKAKGIGQEWIILGNVRDSLRWPEDPSPGSLMAAFRSLEAELVAWCCQVCRVKGASRPRSGSFSSMEYTLTAWARVWDSQVLQLLEAVLYYFAVITNNLKFVLWVKWDRGCGVPITVSSKTLFIRPAAAGKEVLAETQNEWVNVGRLRRGDSAHPLVCCGLQALHWMQK